MNRLLLAADHDPTSLRRGVADGALVRLRRGAYLARSDADGADAWRARERDRIRAVHSALRTNHVLAGPSAALLWNLRLWAPPTQTHVRQASRCAGDS